MHASHDARALRAASARADGNGLASRATAANPPAPPLATAEQLRQRFAVEDERYAALREWLEAMLRKGIDYGVIPGCGSKPSLRSVSSRSSASSAESSTRRSRRTLWVAAASTRTSRWGTRPADGASRQTGVTCASRW